MGATPDERLATFCRERGVDGVVIRRRGNMSWATGGADFHCDTASTFGIAALVWTPHVKTVHTDTIEAPRLRDEEPLDGWEVKASPWWGRDAELANIESSGRYASDAVEDILTDLRSPLSQEEIARAEPLGRDTAEVVERIMREEVKPGISEHHLGGALAGRLRDRGIQAHVVLVAADERISMYRHPIPTAKRIERLAMAAVCAQRNGLIVSVTRLVHFGPLSADLLTRHDAVTRVDSALHDATRVGARWCDALARGVDEYARRGFGDEWKKHHQGGPMGYECRDFKATQTEGRAVKPDQLVGWNPSITGTKSEDTILTAATGPRVITRTGNWPERNARPDILVR